jgi:hypothetical protein
MDERAGGGLTEAPSEMLSCYSRKAGSWVDPLDWGNCRE